MNSNSHFYALARLIYVSDICSPFLATFESDRTVADVWEEWSIDLCGEDYLDPMEQIALVSEKDKVIGWIGFDMLTGETIKDSMEIVKPTSILSSDTTLFDAVSLFAKSMVPFFFVLKGNRFIGWLSHRDLNKPPLRVCLFAMLIDLEKMLLEVILLDPKLSIENLSERRKKKAFDVYSMRGYKYQENGEPFLSKLLECTMLIDKFNIVQRTKSIIDQVPALQKNEFSSQAEKIRNDIAHPGMEDTICNLQTPDALWEFIQWAESMESQLQNYIDEQADKNPRKM